MSAAEPTTPGEAARKAWGEHWADAPKAGRGTPRWDSLAYEAECWEVAAEAARSFPVKPGASHR